MKVTEQVTQFAQPIVESCGCSLWDVEYVREGSERYLRLYIDKEGGVDINDCEKVHRAVDPVLDEQDPMAESYHFEVCSAGLERALKRPSDFEQFMGSPILIKLYRPKNGLKEFPAIASRIKLLGGLNIAESRLPQDGRTNVKLGRTELDMRISTIPILTGESIVLRLLDQGALSFDLKTLGMSAEHLAQFEKLIQIPHGIILVVGPTGSGKTTTLYSVINQLNDSKKKIITIEDPVE